MQENRQQTSAFHQEYYLNEYIRIKGGLLFDILYGALFV